MSRTSRKRFALLVVLVAAGVVPAPVRSAAGDEARESVAAALDSLAAMEAAGRWRDADRAATALLRTLESGPAADSLALARVLERHASYHRVVSPVGDSVTSRSVERAAAISERLRPRDALLLCRVHSMAALVHIDLAQGDSALAHVRRAFEVAQGMAVPDDSVLTGLYFREGQAQRARADYAAAIRALHAARALTLRRLGPEAPGLGLISGELGRSFTYMGEFDSARTELENAVRLAEGSARTSTQRLELALGSLGTLERRTGNPARAVDLFARVHELYVARMGETGPDVTSQLGNLAYALLALGDYARARSLLEQVLERQAATLPPANSFRVQNRIALAQACTRLGDARTARAQLDHVDSLLAAGGMRDRTNIAYAAAVRTGLELREGRYAEAREVLLAAASRNPPELASRLDLAASLYETIRGEPDRALADSLGREVEGWADTTELALTKNWPFVLENRARAEARLGQRTLAWKHARQAEELASRRFRWQVEALPDRQALLHDEESADPSQVLVDLARPDHGGEVRTAWEAVVRRRGAIRDIVEARRDAGAAGDTALAGAHARWVAASRRHAQQLVAGQFDSGEPDARARFEASVVTVEEAERRYAELAAAAGRSPAAPTLAGVLSKLPPGEALVAFVRTQPGFDAATLCAFVARGGEDTIRLVRLGDEAPIAARVDAWMARLETPPPANLRDARAAEAAARAAGDSVRRAVWEPLRPAIGAAAGVRIVAAGALRDLPWIALPAAGGRYLAEGATVIHVHTSERELLRDREPAAAGGLLAVGDPDFDGPPGSTAAPVAFALRQFPGGCARPGVKLGPLPGAREEARAIAGLWDGGAGPGSARLLVGAEATEERFKALAHGRRVIHVATHGILARDTCANMQVATRGVGGVTELAAASPAPKPRQPAATAVKRPAAVAAEPSPWIGRDAWLAFAGANRTSGGAGNGDDGWLTADEVVTLDLRGTERVVLSACQSGVVDHWTQEAVLGMRRAFHLAGARCVLASQWPIADESTRAWMEAFYASRSPSAGGALQDAARAVIAQRRARGLAAHPFFWAAFTATGD